MKIISISGLDGSGKSTQIQLLKNYLEAQGKRVFYFHVVKFGIANKIIKFIKSPLYTFLRPQESVTSERSTTKANLFTVWLRKIFLSVDIQRFESLTKKLEKEGFDYILSDRYFYDSVINIEYLSQCHSERSEESNKKRTDSIKKGSFAFAQDDIIKPDLAIYLEIYPKSIMQRERIPDQGLEYLKKKTELYSNTLNNWNLRIVDGNGSKEEVFEEIKKVLNLAYDK